MLEKYVVLLSNGLWKTFTSKQELQEYALKDGKDMIKSIVVPEKWLDFQYVSTFQIGDE